MGGNRKFVDKLNKVFDEGLYDPSNEPDIAYPYLYSRISGEEWRTQQRVAELLKAHFHNAPDGIPGNDDTGTMSAWAVFSMMGLYPDTPGEPYYTLTTPLFDRIDINHGEIVIEKENATSTPSGIITDITLGGKKLNGYRISHADLMASPTLKFTVK
jgi:putative alpha-1,2-mannosidase